jgi:hypothetical protein
MGNGSLLAKKIIGKQSQSLLLSQIGSQTSRHPSEGRYRDAHSLGRHKDRLVPERRHARDLLSPPAHLLRERIPDVGVGARLDADRLRFCLSRKVRRVRLGLGFDAGALRSGFGGGDNGVCFCVGLRL